MSSFYQFASDSPWLTFFLAMLAIGLITKGLRLVAILARGHPPAKTKPDGVKNVTSFNFTRPYEGTAYAGLSDAQALRHLADAIERHFPELSDDVLMLNRVATAIESKDENPRK